MQSSLQNALIEYPYPFSSALSFNPFQKKALVFTCLQYKSFENIVRKGVISPFATLFSTRLENFQIQNCRLQILLFWKSLKFDIWE